MFELVNVCKTLKTFLTFEAFHHFAMFKYLTYVNVKYVQHRKYSTTAQSYVFSSRSLEHLLLQDPCSQK